MILAAASSRIDRVSVLGFVVFAVTATLLVAEVLVPALFDLYDRVTS